MKIKEIIEELENYAPLSYQENYDNSGLIIGSANTEFKAALLCIDITEEIIEEAIIKGTNLIISHHPIIFSGLKSLTGKNFVERSIIKAIKNDIAIYASHTNMDNVINGVNKRICEKLELINCKVLEPSKNNLKKLVTFIPENKLEKLKIAVFEAGAGHIGKYDNCSYNISGEGSFRALENTNPYVGEKGKIHLEKEIRFETIFPIHLQNKIISTLIKNHPYEEAAYDIYSLDNKNDNIGAGMIGDLENEIDEEELLNKIKEIFNAQSIKHTKFLNKRIKKVALCGGSGSFLLKNAISKKADVFITSDFKYHQFFDAEETILIADIGHYESEQYTKDIFFDILTKKFPNFAFYFTEINTNPVNYY
ncbi:MAG: Nif3-like dinuclear metal center hexameric protein [Bacteroidales bacterium]|nr:Nif3-like dinuclear metal center hexameric protein [Bacteroidales bacterium]MBN2757516.1 Nif3-like dinuclear metal center hexameric protein [Bacteroidales bacterium]